MKTLYVQRPVLNRREFIDWARLVGLPEETLKPDLHITIAYSRDPVEWPTPVGTQLLLPSDMSRKLELFGPDADELVVRINSASLQHRWSQFIEAGCSWDWPDYKPHITVAHRSGLSIKDIPPYKGSIALGPEVFEEVRE